ncbi:MAG TPA: amidohydrolase family protein [Polyangia bacterium]|nr:amidohydrolase family protein [Polyangia bacterium]
MRAFRRELTWLVAALAVACAHAAAPPRRIEAGRFILHKFLQPIGEERYEITSAGDTLTLRTQFEFSDRGTRVPLSATLRARSDLTPIALEIRGRTSRSSAINEIVGPSSAPAPAFTIDGYAPIAVQMLLVRYWQQHGEPARLQTFPRGLVTIERRGHDQIESAGRQVTLTRFAIDGLIWGREWLWLDDAGALVAAITTDAEFDHFEAVREGFETSLRSFVARAAEDGMAVLAGLGARLAPPDCGRLAIVGGRLVDGTGRPPVPDAAVVVEGDRIVAAGPRAGVTIPAGATVVDAHGQTILPGLWDMHAHFEQVEWGPIYLAAGVTSARDCGNELEFITAVRDAVEAGRGLGPRLVLAGIVDGKGPMAIGVDRAQSPTEARALVARYAAAGFAQIKIYESLDPALVPVIAAEAHARGLSVTGHVPRGMDALQAVAAGMDQINHISFIVSLLLPPQARGLRGSARAQAVARVDPESTDARQKLAVLAQRGTVVDPTMALYEIGTLGPAAAREPGLGKLPPALAAVFADAPFPPAAAAERRKSWDQHLAILRALHRAGVRIVAGTDQAVPGHSLHRELELYVQAGFTPMEAIQAATLVPARVMKRERELGTVEPGKRADLIVVDGNPLENIADTRRLRRVIARGRMFDPAPLWQSVGFRP